MSCFPITCVTPVFLDFLQKYLKYGQFVSSLSTLNISSSGPSVFDELKFNSS